MSAHFKFYPSSEESVVPWNARYSFPSQANKALKVTPRIPPKNGADFLPGSVIRLEFPAQGYVNPINTTLEFDVTLTGVALEDTRFQNNIQSIFNRVRLMYGSTPLEDIINYNQVVRNLTEWTSTNQQGTFDQVSISEGIGGIANFIGRSTDGPVGGSIGSVPFNVRQAVIQGVGEKVANKSRTICPNSCNKSGTVTSVTSTRRYQINLALGLLMQDKLLPVKFMASQLAIEITLEQASACIFSTAISTQTYTVQQVNLIPEILEFDSSYDAMFLKGLQDGGVPIKFASWHTFTFGTGSSNLNLQVQERSRSVKALFACLQKSANSLTVDNGATFYDTVASSSMQSYQWRIGGRYFPAQPVDMSIGGTLTTNGACEAFVELQKALNVVGDYRLSSSVNSLRWAYTGAGNDQDYQNAFGYFTTTGGLSVLTSVLAEGNSGNVGSQCFCSSIDLETSNGIEISGLNAEEMSDIAFIGRWTLTQVAADTVMRIFTYFDSMIILRENNVLELIQ